MQAPSRALGVASGVTGEEHVPRRLVEGLAAAIVEKGYAATTIADIVRHARVSKRTFYEHFADKEACFLAGYTAVSAETLQIIVAAASLPGLSWPERVRVTAKTYLEALESQPELTRTYLLEIHAAGERAVEQRRLVHRQFADALRSLVEAARAEMPELRPLTPEMAIAIVGGVNELVLVAIEGHKSTKLAHLAETAADLFMAVILRPAPSTRGPTKRVSRGASARTTR